MEKNTSLEAYSLTTAQQIPWRLWNPIIIMLTGASH
jgi:hypothetical protein